MFKKVSFVIGYYFISYFLYLYTLGLIVSTSSPALIRFQKYFAFQHAELILPIALLALIFYLILGFLKFGKGEKLIHVGIYLMIALLFLYL